MIGGNSAPWLRNAGRSVAAVLPDAVVLDMPGLHHDTPLTRPSALADTVLGFLRPDTDPVATGVVGEAS